MATNNYVRFLRGTPTAYEALKTNNKISDNTLYFISESNSATGKLYLGSKLIAGLDSDNPIPTNLSELADVITENAATGSFLVYTDEGKWEAQTASEVASQIVTVMKGATSTNDGASGLVPVPKAGEHTLFLRGDGTWADPTSSLTAVLYKDAADGQSIKEIAINALAESLIPENAQESLDTLQEISDWIQTHPTEVSAMNTSISNLETKVGNLEDVLNDKTEEAEGEEEPTVIPGLITKVGNLENKIKDLESDYQQIDLQGIDQTIVNIENKVDEVDARLKWVDLNDDGTENSSESEG